MFYTLNARPKMAVFTTTAMDARNLAPVAFIPITALNIKASYICNLVQSLGERGRSIKLHELNLLY